jgi:hypothetical protein
MQVGPVRLKTQVKSITESEKNLRIVPNHLHHIQISHICSLVAELAEVGVRRPHIMHTNVNTIK